MTYISPERNQGKASKLKITQIPVKGRLDFLEDQAVKKYASMFQKIDNPILKSNIKISNNICTIQDIKFYPRSSTDSSNWNVEKVNLKADRRKKSAKESLAKKNQSMLGKSKII